MADGMAAIILSLVGFAALFAAIWLLHKPLDVHGCPRRAVRATHIVLEWVLVAWLFVLAAQVYVVFSHQGEEMDNPIARIAEIEIHPEWQEKYLEAARTVGSESVAKEPGVVCIFPMRKAENPCSLRIVEIYRDEAAYKAHLETPHFRAYKDGTLHMIKSLNLVPMQPLDKEHMNLIFRKSLTK